jgi:hypothetical protein
MKTYELPAERWVDFFSDFSRTHVGWPATIEVLSPETGPQRLAAELPLQGVSFDPAGSRPCTITMGAGDGPSANISHTVDMPLHIRVAEDESGERGTIEIEPARGAATLMHYHHA